jgi:microcystin-dependent protein
MAEPFLSEIRMMSFVFPPKGWTLCNGALLPINQNQALFSLLGTTYGGDGRVNFGLPNLQGNVPIHMGSGFTLGERGGEYNHTLNTGEMAQHIHTMMAKAQDANAGATGRFPGPTGTKSLAQGHASQGVNPVVPVNIYGTGSPAATLSPGTIGRTGGGQAHQNTQPYLTISFCIALQGIFPSPN